MNESASHSPQARRHPRYACQLASQLRVLCPEMTFTPMEIQAQLLDISLTGARLITRQLTKDYYLLLIREVRQAKIEVDLDQKNCLKLRARIVWMDYSLRECFLGVQFLPLDPDNSRLLEMILTKLEKLGTLIEVETSRPVFDESHSWRVSPEEICTGQK